MIRRWAFLIVVTAAAACIDAQTVEKQSWKIVPGEMSAKKAGQIVAEYAKKLGIRDLDIKAYRCFARSTTGDDSTTHREWLFYKNNDDTDYEFSINTRTSEFRDYLNWKLVKKNLKDHDSLPGPFAQTRSSMNAHVLKYVKLLGLPQPLAVRLSASYGHDGQIRKPYMSMMAHYERLGRSYSLGFDKQTGELCQFHVQNNHEFEDRLVANYVSKPKPTKLAQAKKTAIAFVKKIGIKACDPADIMANYSGGMGVPRSYYSVKHPLWYATVDAKTLQVLGFTSWFIEDHFEKGDKPCAANEAEAATLIHKYGSLLGLSRQNLNAKITNGMVPEYGWVGWIEGEYKSNGKAIARIRLDLLKGQLLTLTYDPKGIPEPIFKH